MATGRPRQRVDRPAVRPRVSSRSGEHRWRGCRASLDRKGEQSRAVTGAKLRRRRSWLGRGSRQACLETCHPVGCVSPRRFTICSPKSASLHSAKKFQMESCASNSVLPLVKIRGSRTVSRKLRNQFPPPAVCFPLPFQPQQRPPPETTCPPPVLASSTGGPTAAAACGRLTA